MMERDKGWFRPLDDAIILPGGRALRTLRDAGEFIAALPKVKHYHPEWRFAAAMLMQAADNGAPVMLAEMAIRRALHSGKPEQPEPPRKGAKNYRIVR
jgi:hypothetical protein